VDEAFIEADIEADIETDQLKLTKALANAPRKQNIARTIQIKNTIKKKTGSIGSIVEPFYQPHLLLSTPPRPEDVTLELLMASQSHMGHSTSLWNPANQQYIYGIRQGIHIISLEQTAAHLRRAAKVVEGVAYNGGLILFVGTRAGHDRCVIQAAKLVKGCHLFQRWIPGSITNGEKILGRCPTKVVNVHDEELKGFDGQLREMAVLKPDLVVCLNPLENYICLHECGLHNVPTIGIIDTDANPTWVTYPIPANDDSLRCVQVIAGVLGRAGEAGQKKRLEQAKNGVRTWEPRIELTDPNKEKSEV